MMSRALVACGERGIASGVRRILEVDGWEVSVGDDESSTARFVQSSWDLVVLGPGLDGAGTRGLCTSMRESKRHRDTAIMILDDACSDEREVLALESGADDYQEWPLRDRVFRARLRSIVRRLGGVQSGVVHVGEGSGGIEIDPRRHSVRVDTREIDLTLTQYRILQYLAQRPGFVRTREQIVAAVRGGNTVLSSRAVDVHVVALRQKLGAKGTIIETVRGVGYRLSESVGQSAGSAEMLEASPGLR